MIWIDIKYAHLLTIHLERHQIKTNSPFVMNCRCPICGDSRKSKSKMRGYIFQKPGGLFYSCHNCQWSGSFSRFLKLVAEPLYDQWKLETIKERVAIEGGTPKSPVEIDFRPSFADVLEPVNEIRRFEGTFPSLTSLPNSHRAVAWASSRRIPKVRWTDIRYAEDVSLLAEIFPEYEDRLVKEPRILIPFIGPDNELIGVTCRSFASRGPKYLTVKRDSDSQLIYGVDRADKLKPVVVVEGPIDSMFISNAVAANGTALEKVTSMFDNTVLVFDNQPRNAQVVRIIEKSIEHGHNVFIWPPDITDVKDINDFVIRHQINHSPDRLREFVLRNSYSGLRLKLAFAEWKKIKRST